MKKPPNEAHLRTVCPVPLPRAPDVHVATVQPKDVPHEVVEPELPKNTVNCIKCDEMRMNLARTLTCSPAVRPQSSSDAIHGRQVVPHVLHEIREGVCAVLLAAVLLAVEVGQDVHGLDGFVVAHGTVVVAGVVLLYIKAGN